MELGKWLLALFMALSLGFLGAKVVMSVSGMFELDFIYNLGYFKVYALLSIIALATQDSTKQKYEEVEDAVTAIATKAFSYLIFWGIMSLIYVIFLK